MSTRLRLGLLSLTIFLLLGFAWVGPTQAQSPEEVNDIAHKLNCPTCQSLNLADCPTQTCEQWRGVIRDQLSKGKSEEEIIQFFVDQYGEQVLYAPPKRGFYLLGWLGPFAALAVGGVFLAYALKGWVERRREGEGEPSQQRVEEELPDEYLQRLEEDLERLK